MRGILSSLHRASATGVLQNNTLTLRISYRPKKTHKNPAEMLSLELLNSFLHEYHIIDHSVVVSDMHQDEQDQTPTASTLDNSTTITTTTIAAAAATTTSIEDESTEVATNKRKTPPTVPQSTLLTDAHRKRQKQEQRLEAQRRRIANHIVYHHELEDGFYGDLISLYYEDAIATAQYAHTLPLVEGKYHFHNFWVDASGCSGSAGAAIAYKDPEYGEEWVDWGYAIAGLKHEKRVEVSELWAIGAALRIALGRIGKRVATAEGVEEHAVTVFSGSICAMAMIRRWANPWSRDEVSWSVFGAIAEDVCGLSKQLWELGVKVRVYWLPAHCDVCIVGHKRADVLSKAAARHVKLLQERDAKFSADEVIQLVDSGFLKTLLLLTDECEPL
ncbi:hypothetical protein BDV26DRAFT_303433 [Aspergillus bertholletiae]|uniref:RNase H type-1 domain-containing protein n=1 Tax=Aspergillus bertholletiae TaxID=1226010 RepID=A0A5N7BDA7_9EURO|nr:hypothetical protein BDV26DRAFT_303433 [Aspergillus bertholletiae]